MSDDELRENFDADKTDMTRRKLVGREAAKRIGGEDAKDSAGDAKTVYGQIYAGLRDYGDLAEDVLLQSAKKAAQQARDEERVKDIEAAQRDLTKIKKDLEEAPYEAGGVTVSQEDVMEELREARREWLKELGIR